MSKNSVWIKLKRYDVQDRLAFLYSGVDRLQVDLMLKILSMMGIELDETWIDARIKLYSKMMEVKPNEVQDLRNSNELNQVKEEHEPIPEYIRSRSGNADDLSTKRSESNKRTSKSSDEH